MDLQDPTKKMSKSDGNLNGCILLSDSADNIRRKVMRAVTDSGSVVEASEDKPALVNLLVIFSLLSGMDISGVESNYAGKGYGAFKSDLADLVVDSLSPIQAAHDAFLADDKRVDEILAKGAAFAGQIANSKMKVVKTKLGLL